jgi:hypothetical protein
MKFTGAILFSALVLIQGFVFGQQGGGCYAQKVAADNHWHIFNDTELPQVITYTMDDLKDKSGITTGTITLKAHSSFSLIGVRSDWYDVKVTGEQTAVVVTNANDQTNAETNSQPPPATAPVNSGEQVNPEPKPDKEASIFTSTFQETTDTAKPTGTIGVTLEQEPGQFGVIILSVKPDSPAARAGLKRLDHIASINGDPVAGCDFDYAVYLLSDPGRSGLLMQDVLARLQGPVGAQLAIISIGLKMKMQLSSKQHELLAIPILRATPLPSLLHR